MTTDQAHPTCPLGHGDKAKVSPSDFRPDDPRTQQDPYPYYPALREVAPVLESSFDGQPCWILSRRKDIQKALLDPKTFSSKTTPIPIMLFEDPPVHGPMRQMVAARFTPPAVAALEPQIEDIATRLMRDWVTQGSCDVIADFAGPLTVATIGLVLGIPLEDVEEMRRLTRLQQEYVLSVRLGREPTRESREANDGLVEFMADIIRSRRYEPGQVVSDIAERLRAGELDEVTAANFAAMLFIAGHSTTTNLIGNATYILTQRPDDLLALSDDPEFLLDFVEEVLRTRPSFHRNMRITTKDVTMREVTIPKGSIVRLLLASANRDPEYYERPEEFLPTEERRDHLAFGRGIHTCLGAWLARLEARVALRSLGLAASSVALEPHAPPMHLAGGTFNEFGFRQLQVRISPRHPRTVNQ